VCGGRTYRHTGHATRATTANLRFLNYVLVVSQHASSMRWKTQHLPKPTPSVRIYRTSLYTSALASSRCYQWST